jgi:hypothetical protein
MLAERKSCLAKRLPQALTCFSTAHMLDDCFPAVAYKQRMTLVRFPEELYRSRCARSSVERRPAVTVASDKVRRGWAAR